MMRLRWVLVALALGISAAQAQDVAYVSPSAVGTAGAGRYHGNAWLFNRGGVCYALTPLHVLWNPAANRDVRYVQLELETLFKQSVIAQADRCVSVKDADLALLRVSGVADLANCGRPLVGTSIANVLQGSPLLNMVTADPGGLLRWVPLEMRASMPVDSGSFAIVSRAEKLTGGMSGSLVLANEQIAGLLMKDISVDEGAEAGTFSVFRIDRATALLARMFLTPDSAVQESPRCLISGAAPAVIDTGNRLDPRCGATVTAWSSPPVAEDNRPERMLETTAQAKPAWRSQFREEMTVDVHMCPSRSADVSELQFDTTNCQGDDNRGVEVDVQVQQGQSSGYVSLGHAPLSNLTRLTVRSDLPLHGQNLQLRFLGRGASTVCVASLLGR